MRNVGNLNLQVPLKKKSAKVKNIMFYRGLEKSKKKTEKYCGVTLHPKTRRRNDRKSKSSCRSKFEMHHQSDALMEGIRSGGLFPKLWVGMGQES